MGFSILDGPYFLTHPERIEGQQMSLHLQNVVADKRTRVDVNEDACSPEVIISTT